MDSGSQIRNFNLLCEVSSQFCTQRNMSDGDQDFRFFEVILGGEIYSLVPRYSFMAKRPEKYDKIIVICEIVEN